MIETRSMGARGELTEIQTALESARGAAALPLLLAQAKLLAEHADELWGPLAQSAATQPANFRWRRGYLDELHAPLVDVHAATSPSPNGLLAAAFADPSASALRRVWAPYWVRNAPHSIEHLALQQAVVTARLMALPRLRSLSIQKLVDSPPLRSASLSHVALRAQPPLASALLGAELPALKALLVEGIDYRTKPSDLLHMLSPLAHAALSLSIQGRVGNHHWTGADFAELEPVFGSIAELTLNDPLPGLDATLPSVRRLMLKAYNAIDRSNRTSWVLPVLPAVEHLKLRLFRPGAGSGGLFDQLVAYRPTLRGLHVTGWDPQLLESFLSEPMPALSDLALEFHDPRRLDQAGAAYAAPAFERVTTLSIGFGRTLDKLAASPLAERLETLSMIFGGDHGLEIYLPLRDRFPKLKLVVVRGPAAFSATTLAKLYEQGHDVVIAGAPTRWPELELAPGSPCDM